MHTFFFFFLRCPWLPPFYAFFRSPLIRGSGCPTVLFVGFSGFPFLVLLFSSSSHLTLPPPSFHSYSCHSFGLCFVCLFFLLQLSVPSPLFCGQLLPCSVTLFSSAFLARMHLTHASVVVTSIELLSTVPFLNVFCRWERCRTGVFSFTDAGP